MVVHEKNRISPFIKTREEANREARRLKGHVAYSDRLRRYFVAKGLLTGHAQAGRKTKRA